MWELKEGGDLEIKSEYVVLLWREAPKKPENGGAPDPSTTIHAKLEKVKTGNGLGHRWKYLQNPNGALLERPEIDGYVAAYDEFSDAQEQLDV